MIMKTFRIYDLNRFIETCGNFFMIEYGTDQSAHMQKTCRVHVGCKGPVKEQFPPEQMSYCYIGEFGPETILVEPVVWTGGLDGSPESNALAFLEEHRIPYNVKPTWELSRKPGGWLISREGVLTEQSLLTMNKSTVRRETSVSIDYYPRPNFICEASDSAVSVKSAHIYYLKYGDVDADAFLDALREADMRAGMTPQQFKALFPKMTSVEYSYYLPLPVDSHEKFACRDHAYRIEKNALVVSDFFCDEVDVFLAHSITSSLMVPCRVLLHGPKHEVTIPWQADIENEFLVFLDRKEQNYLFVPVNFERREDGSFTLDLTGCLQELGISLKLQTKAKCRKLRNRVWYRYQHISAGPNGFCLGIAMRDDAKSNLYYENKVWLKDAKLCGKTITDIYIRTTRETQNALFWLPDEIEQLFRWGGDITEERLLEEGESLLHANGVEFVTDDGYLLIDAKHGTSSEETDRIEFYRDFHRIAHVDLSGMSWQERASALIDMLRSV